MHMHKMHKPAHFAIKCVYVCLIAGSGILFVNSPATKITTPHQNKKKKCDLHLHSKLHFDRMSRCTLYHSERVRETLIMHNSHKTHVRLREKKNATKIRGGRIHIISN